MKQELQDFLGLLGCNLPITFLQILHFQTYRNTADLSKKQTPKIACRAIFDSGKRCSFAIPNAFFESIAEKRIGLSI